MRTIRVAAVLCALVVTSTYCGGGGGPVSPTAPPVPSPSPGPSPAPGPVGRFTIACGTTPLDLVWNGTDTRACTVTSTNGFDGDVALSCSGVPGASCDFDPPTVRPTPDRAATATLKLTYSDATAFGIFDAAVRGEAAAGSTTANATVNVQRDGNSLTRHCPSAADVAAIDGAVLLDLRHDPTAGKFVCLASEGSRDLTYFQANVYKGLTMMRRISFTAPLPWTSGSLWQWFTSSVRGIRFLNQNTGSCCGRDRMISFPTINAAAHPEQVVFTRVTDLMSFMSIAIHEARHANGNSYPHCAGNKDRSIAEMGAMGVQYHFNRLMAESTPPGFTAAQERIGLLNVARIHCNNSFCEPQVCNF